MAKLPILSGKDVVKILSRIGYQNIRIRGSHIVMVKQTKEGKKTIPVPNHPEISKGTLKAIMSQAGLKRDDLMNLL